MSNGSKTKGKRARREPVRHLLSAYQWMTLHRDSGQAYVMLDGRRCHVGRMLAREIDDGWRPTLELIPEAGGDHGNHEQKRKAAEGVLRRLRKRLDGTGVGIVGKRGGGAPFADAADAGSHGGIRLEQPIRVESDRP